MTTLSPRTINRATLARQHLLARTEQTAVDMAEHLVGLQAQAPFPPYTGLWTRLAGFQPEELAAALVDRQVVRIALMRGTVHLVSAADACFLRPLVQPLYDRDLRTNIQHARHLTGLDLAKVADATRLVLAERPHNTRELGATLAEHWPDRDAAALTHAARGLLPLVQVPPRAVWGRSGQTAYQTAEHWLGRELDRSPDPKRMITRYLNAFGPASVADIQTWAGLTRLREIVETLDLRTFHTADGRELYDLPDAVLPDEDTPAPARFIPEFDNVLLSYADRTRIIAEDHRKRLFGVKNGVFPGTFLVDGFVRGSWRVAKERKSAVLTITPWARTTRKDLTALTREGLRLLDFLAPAAETKDVRIDA
ncbi:winged helix DNA-binding domain-containing protein [Actinophytocola sp.]|uniref:winged helix DNA-binding domain-containing protein n=1 Tax=Actinophytocola sp. TaxID=1872138 RepID=UPI002D5E42D6|nr:winged helix DNA-binding domain-containing protein [Actinophytocola sp.]HYQ63582.1 winged helix DNA-binding domain-containing protein [Actinophytocola sp.]